MHTFYPAANVSDALGKTNTMDAGINPVTPGLTVCGPAYTVDCPPDGIITCHKALGEVPAGHVLVVDGKGGIHGAIWGELTSMEAMKRGVLGIVVDGAVRDSATIRKLGFPTWSRYVTPRVASNRTVGVTGEPVVCGGVPVRTGDYIIADDDGVVVIPVERLDEIMAKAAAIEAKEADLARKVEEGVHLADVLGMSGLIAEADAARAAQKGAKK